MIASIVEALEVKEKELEALRDQLKTDAAENEKLRKQLKRSADAYNDRRMELEAERENAAKKHRSEMDGLKRQLEEIQDKKRGREEDLLSFEVGDWVTSPIKGELIGQIQTKDSDRYLVEWYIDGKCCIEGSIAEGDTRYSTVDSHLVGKLKEQCQRNDEARMARMARMRLGYLGHR